MSLTKRDQEKFLPSQGEVRGPDSDRKSGEDIVKAMKKRWSTDMLARRRQRALERQTVQSEPAQSGKLGRLIPFGGTLAAGMALFATLSGYFDGSPATPAVSRQISRGESFTVYPGGVVVGDMESELLGGWLTFPLHDNDPSTGSVIEVVDRPIKMYSKYGGKVQYPGNAETTHQLKVKLAAALTEGRNCQGNGCLEVDVTSARSRQNIGLVIVDTNRVRRSALVYNR